MVQGLGFLDFLYYFLEQGTSKRSPKNVSNSGPYITVLISGGRGFRMKVTPLLLPKRNRCMVFLFFNRVTLPKDVRAPHMHEGF